MIAVRDAAHRLSLEQVHRLGAEVPDTPAAAEARRRALSPDLPGVVDLLADWAELAAHLGRLGGPAGELSLSPERRARAMRTIVDALAAAYAAEELPRAATDALSAGWRATLG